MTSLIGMDRFLFESLVTEYSRRLLAMAYRYTFDWDVASDLCQDTWLRAWKMNSMYDPGLPFDRWLFTIHRNVCLDHLRKRKRSRETSAELYADGIAAFPSPAAGPDREAELSQARQRIIDVASTLSERQRTVFSMIDLEQMTVEEAAVILGIKPASVRTNLHYARRNIASRLRGPEEK